MVKNPPAMWETWEDTQEEGTAIHSSIFLPGKSPWTEEPGRLQSMGLQRVRHDWVSKQHTGLHVHNLTAQAKEFLSVTHSSTLHTGLKDCPPVCAWGHKPYNFAHGYVSRAHMAMSPCGRHIVFVRKPVFFFLLIKKQKKTYSKIHIMSQWLFAGEWMTILPKGQTKLGLIHSIIYSFLAWLFLVSL